jgi:hypothetical protein
LFEATRVAMSGEGDDVWSDGSRGVWIFSTVFASRADGFESSEPSDVALTSWRTTRPARWGSRWR